MEIANQEKKKLEIGQVPPQELENQLQTRAVALITLSTILKRRRINKQQDKEQFKYMEIKEKK